MATEEAARFGKRALPHRADFAGLARRAQRCCAPTKKLKKGTACLAPTREKSRRRAGKEATQFDIARQGHNLTIIS